MEKINYPIYLIGMPGSGKSEIATQLAKTLHIEHIDLDDEIEKHSHMYIHEIFERYGEATFRQKETDALLEVSQRKAVIACGGGIILNESHKKTMNQGTVIYLMVDVDVIEKRIRHTEHRPLLKKTSLKQLFEERRLKYIDFADVTILNDGEVDETIESILNFIKRRNS